MSIVIFDLDGTLALIEHRLHHIQKDKPDWDAFFLACDGDKLNTPVFEVYQALRDAGHTMWIFSGRGKISEKDTVSWLLFNDIEFARLVMREEGDFTPDDELKESWLKKYFPVNTDNLLCVFDDRAKVVDMWRRNGVTCCQVAAAEF